MLLRRICFAYTNAPSQQGMHVAISSSLEFQALRIVLHDLKELHSWDWINNVPHAFLVIEFPCNLWLLEKSRRLTVRVAPRIVEAALHTLSDPELVILRNALCLSWLDVDVEQAKELTEDLALRVTPNAYV